MNADADCPHCSRPLSECGEDTMCVYSGNGTRVVFLGENGYPGEADTAAQTLTAGTTYVVEETAVGEWDSSVRIVGFDGWFNTVMFGRVNQPSE